MADKSSNKFASDWAIIMLALLIASISVFLIVFSGIMYNRWLNKEVPQQYKTQNADASYNKISNDNLGKSSFEKAESSGESGAIASYSEQMPLPNTQTLPDSGESDSINEAIPNADQLGDSITNTDFTNIKSNRSDITTTEELKEFTRNTNNIGKTVTIDATVEKVIQNNYVLLLDEYPPSISGKGVLDSIVLYPDDKITFTGTYLGFDTVGNPQFQTVDIKLR